MIEGAVCILFFCCMGVGTLLKGSGDKIVSYQQGEEIYGF